MYSHNGNFRVFLIGHWLDYVARGRDCEDSLPCLLKESVITFINPELLEK